MVRVELIHEPLGLLLRALPPERSHRHGYLSLANLPRPVGVKERESPLYLALSLSISLPLSLPLLLLLGGGRVSLSLSLSLSLSRFVGDVVVGGKGVELIVLLGGDAAAEMIALGRERERGEEREIGEERES